MKRRLTEDIDRNNAKLRSRTCLEGVLHTSLLFKLPLIPYYIPEKHLDFDDECREIKVFLQDLKWSDKELEMLTHCINSGHKARSCNQ